MPTAPRFYVSTPIYYVNARPHIGHIYSTTIADVIARYHRLRGDDVFFLTGTDEHGTKVNKAAAEMGVSPQAYSDAIAGEFQAVFKRLGITHNDFIRTTQPRHEKRVQEFVQKLIDSGDIYLGEYEGWYDQGQEEYVTETNARVNEYKSPVSGRPLTRVKEKNYFFRLSKYQEAVGRLIEEHPEFVQPDARRNEVLGRIREGLNDLAISRSTEPWGIAMPNDPGQTIYVWVDALFNYLTVIEEDREARGKYWPADVHLIGKEILWFHAVIWPALLMALKLPLPRQVYAHSHWISEGQKMSKSLGNFIDLEKIDHYVETFSLDALRWFLATQGPLGTTDSDFAEAKFIEVYNTDLANTLGNCFSRVCNMMERYVGGLVPQPGDHYRMPFNPRDLAEVYSTRQRIHQDVAADGMEYTLQQNARWAVSPYVEEMDNLRIAEACMSALGLVKDVDSFIEGTQPFKLAKDPAKLPEVSTILYQCLEALRIASLLLWPVIPTKVEEIWRRLGCDYAAQMAANAGRGQLEAWRQWGQLQPGTPIEHGQPLFPRHQAS